MCGCQLEPKSLLCCPKGFNPYSPRAVKVTKSGRTFGHLPKRISATCFLFIWGGGTIQCKVTDSHRKYMYCVDLVQGGLDIPCILLLWGHKRSNKQANKLLALSSEQTQRIHLTEPTRPLLHHLFQKWWCSSLSQENESGAGRGSMQQWHLPGCQGNIFHHKYQTLCGGRSNDSGWS